MELGILGGVIVTREIRGKRRPRFNTILTPNLCITLIGEDSLQSALGRHPDPSLHSSQCNELDVTVNSVKTSQELAGAEGIISHYDQ